MNQTITHMSSQASSSFQHQAGMNPNPIMMRRLTPSLLAVGLLAMGLSTTHAIEPTIENPGFETGDKQPEGWTSIPNRTPPAMFNWVSGSPGQEVHEGVLAIQIQNPTAGSEFNRWQLRKASRFAVEAGVAYEIRCWVKGTRLDLDEDTFKIGIEWYGASLDEPIKTWISEPMRVEANDVWKAYTVVTTDAPEGAEEASLQLFFARSDVSSSDTPAMTFDDISIKPRH